MTTTLFWLFASSPFLSEYSEALAIEVDVFKGKLPHGAHIKWSLLFELFEDALKLEGYNILDVSSEVISEVAAAVEVQKC